MNYKPNIKESHSRIVVLGGGKWQVPLIKFLNSKGHLVFVIDPYANSPGVPFAFKHIKENVINFESIINRLKLEQFEFILTDQSDVAVLSAANLNKFFNLPGPSLEVVSKFSKKLETRRFLKACGFKTPSFIEVKSPQDIREFIQDVGLPVMLKPSDSQSSRGIFKIDKNLLENIDTFFQLALNESPSKTLILEEFMVGVEITVEGFSSRFKHYSLALSKKKHFRTGIASELRYPADINESLYSKIVKINDAYVEKTGLQFGMTHAEYIVNEDTDEVNLVEIACRGGGSLISSHITPWVSGLNIYELYYQSLLNPEMDLQLSIPMKRPALLKFFEFPSGKVKKIHGLEDVLGIDDVLRCELEFSVGDLICQASDDRRRQGFVIILSECEIRLKEVEVLIDNLLMVEYE